jgi:uncharacterized protein YebE (UPF0316 family)
MIFQILILFAIGVLEELIAILYYKACEKEFKYATGIFQILRVFIWYFVLRTIIENIDNLWLILSYAGGGAWGDYISLTIQPHLEKKILYIHKLFKKKKGRKKKFGWILSREKTRK